MLGWISLSKVTRPVPGAWTRFATWVLAEGWVPVHLYNPAGSEAVCGGGGSAPTPASKEVTLADVPQAMGSSWSAHPAAPPSMEQGTG